MRRAKITPVILSGGAGTRLWPLSRSLMPKQMLRLVGSESLIQSAALRAPTSLGFEAPVIVAGEAHLVLIEQQMREAGVLPAAIILEPVGRNTAPAIALAAHELDTEILMLVMPSDQIIKDTEAFLAAVEAAAPIAAGGTMVTFGITPSRAETGYGYIESGEEIAPGVRHVLRFVEKPDVESAQRYLDSGRHFWNAGIFLIRAGTYLEALREHEPNIARVAAHACHLADRRSIIVRPDREAFLASPSNSIDYAVMEKASNVAVVPVDMGWSDIGAFAALWEESPRDENGNALIGDVLSRDCRNILVRSDGPLVAAVGIDNVSVIATGDAVLVVSHDRSQEVKHIADALKDGRPSHLNRPCTETAAWGSWRNVTNEAVSARIYFIQSGATAPIDAPNGGHAILCGGEAAVRGAALSPGTPTAIAKGNAEISATGDTPATILVTILPTGDDTG